MSGRRLLDVIQFFNVSKSIAAKHLAIRQRQLDVYTRTSSLTKGIKEQTDGLILTAQAAAALARRFDDSPPPTSSPTTVSPASSADTPGPSSSSSSSSQQPVDTVTSPTSDNARVQKHDAEIKLPSTTTQYTGAEKADLKVSQQQDVFYEPSQQTAPDLSAQPRVKLPAVAADVQAGSGDGLNADVFHAATGPEGKNTPAGEPEPEMSEEMMQGLFQNPRVSRALSGRPRPKRDWIPAEKSAHQFAAPATAPAPESESEIASKTKDEEIQKLAASVAEDVTSASKVTAEQKAVPYQMMESRVPSSRLGRLWQYGGLATSMAFGAVSESVRRATGSQESGSVMFSAGNMERMVAKLSKMRGAALKLGQMLSIQGMFDTGPSLLRLQD